MCAYSYQKGRLYLCPCKTDTFVYWYQLIVKLASLVFFVGQGASAERLCLYTLAATFVYMAQVGAFNGIARLVLGENVLNGNGGRNGGNGGEGRNGGHNVGAAAARAAAGLPPLPPPGPRTTAILPGMRHGMPTSWFGEVKIVLGGFLASLLPSWEPPELHRHVRAAPAHGAPALGRPHQD